MTNNFDRILDECIDRINRGESLEDCLADYTEYVEQLEPLLWVILQTRQAYSFVPSDSAKREARQRFNAALEKLQQRRWGKQPLLTRVFARPIVWATVAAAIVIIIAAYFGFRPMLSPTGPGPSQVSPIPDPEGNFVFLISDDVNAIEDFTSINITISKIGLLPSGDSNEWLEFEPEVKEVDLTQVKGDKTQQIWRGNVAEDQYNKVFIYIDDIRGILKETGKEVEVRLPSQKLHISKPFTISDDTVVSFIFDITVIRAGKSGQYNLQPQVDQSGAVHTPIEGKEKGKKH